MREKNRDKMNFRWDWRWREKKEGKRYTHLLFFFFLSSSEKLRDKKWMNIEVKGNVKNIILIPYILLRLLHLLSFNIFTFQNHIVPFLCVCPSNRENHPFKFNVIQSQKINFTHRNTHKHKGTFTQKERTPRVINWFFIYEYIQLFSPHHKYTHQHHSPQPTIDNFFWLLSHSVTRFLDDDGMEWDFMGLRSVEWNGIYTI